MKQLCGLILIHNKNNKNKMGQQKGNPTPSYQNQAYETLRPNTNARENRDYGTKPVMIDDTKTLDELIDSGSQGFTQGYAKDTDLTDGTINARFDTLTANEYHVTILSSSVMYANGSNKLGDSADDRHEFTGSILIGGDVLGNFRLNQATASLQQTTASLNTYTGSNDSVRNRVLQTTASLNTYTGSNDSVISRILQTTSSLNIATASLNITTASLISTGTQLAAIMAYTASLLSVKLHSGSLVNYANDAAAATGGVPVGNLYHTAGAVKVRLT
jgi:hypothetical protein